MYALKKKRLRFRKAIQMFKNKNPKKPCMDIF